MRGALRGGLSAGLFGEAFWASDIGGFCGPAPSTELYCRWVALGMLSGLSRFHGTTPREPWHFGEEAVAVTRKMTNLRYSLMPYILSATHEAVEQGLPLMRHLALEFPDEPHAAHIDDQYMFGPSILVAPIINEGESRRSVYLPRGRWYRFGTDHSFEGNGYYHCDAALDEILLFVKAGTVLPRYKIIPQHLKQPSPQSILLEVYAGRGSGRLTINEEDRVHTLGYTLDAERCSIVSAGDPVDLDHTLYAEKDIPVKMEKKTG
jgi:alpha-D-xyloside xylohydrolase